MCAELGSTDEEEKESIKPHKEARLIYRSECHHSRCEAALEDRAAEIIMGVRSVRTGAKQLQIPISELRGEEDRDEIGFVDEREAGYMDTRYLRCYGLLKKKMSWILTGAAGVWEQRCHQLVHIRRLPSLCLPMCNCYLLVQS